MQCATVPLPSILRILSGFGTLVNSKVPRHSRQFKAYSIKFRCCNHLTTQTRPAKSDVLEIKQVRQNIPCRLMPTCRDFLRFCEPECKVQHVIFLISRIFQFIVVFHILTKSSTRVSSDDNLYKQCTSPRQLSLKY